MAKHQQGGPAKKSLWSFEAFPEGGGDWKSLEDAVVPSYPFSRFAAELFGDYKEILMCTSGVAISLPALMVAPRSRLRCCAVPVSSGGELRWITTARMSR